jgi:hypothetical protein
MGRNSVEATKASLMRAVCARRAALTLGLTGFFAALPALLAGFVDFFAVVLAGLAAVAPAGFFTVGDGFWAALRTGFFAVGAGFFAGVEAEPASAVAEPPEDCPANGSTISSVESRTATRREASRETKVGEDATLISSLYLL